MAQLKLGIVGGLGAMASPMAIHWKPDSPARMVRVHDRGTAGEKRDLSRTAWKQHGARLVSNFRELVGGGDLDGYVVCAGKNGDDLKIISELAKTIEPKSNPPFICHLSTVSTQFAESAQKFLAKKNIEYVNYPLTGGSLGAERATMLILASGPLNIFERLQPSLKCLGNPRYFGERVSAAAEVKFMGHLMVFNGLMGITSAAALHSSAFQQGNFGGEGQVAFFEFLNGGAGGTRQWDVVLKTAASQGDFKTGFGLGYAAVDAVYTAQLCLERGLPAISSQAVLNVALAFSFVMNKVDSQLATQSIVREMITVKAKELDQFTSHHAAKPGDTAESIKKCIASFPQDLQPTVYLSISEKDFA